MNDNWETPSWLKEHFKNHYDPCPPNPNFDGLKIDWKFPAFVNPPYSNPKEWVMKAIEQNKMWGGLLCYCSEWMFQQSGIKC